jgi:carboxyl-terminal processing protease
LIHTNYFAPEEKERFDVSMSGKLEGIGARLQKKMTSPELISGGSRLGEGNNLKQDLVMKVAQGNELAVDVVGCVLMMLLKDQGPR